VRSDAFIAREHLAGLAAVVSTERHRHDLVGEPSRVGVGRGPLLALERERVHVVATDAEFVGQHLRDPELDAERVVGVIEERGAERADAATRIRRHRHPCHRLDPAGNREVVGTGQHALGDEVHCLLRRSALPIDARRRHLPRQTGRHPRVARDVAALLPHLADAAADDVVDQRGVEVVTLDQLAEEEAEQIGGVPSRERTVAFADRRAGGVDDHRFASRGPCGDG